MNNSEKFKFRPTDITSYLINPYKYELKNGSEKTERLKNILLTIPQIKENFFPDPSSEEIENQKYAEELFYNDYLKIIRQSKLDHFDSSEREKVVMLQKEDIQKENIINLTANQEYPFYFKSDTVQAASTENIRKFGLYECAIDDEIHDHISADIELEDNKKLILKIISKKEIKGRAFKVIFIDEFGSKKYILGKIGEVRANVEEPFSFGISKFPIDSEKLASLKSNKPNEISRCKIILESSTDV